MDILASFFNTPGTGGLFVVIFLVLLILVYSLTIRWISKGGKE